VYFKNFDIFKLKGNDTLEQPDNNSVEVRYEQGMPISIKYYKPGRTITLLLEDSFMVSKVKPIYVYTTSNFHGGNPGPNRVYATHHEEYKDLIYVSQSDTLICQTEKVPVDENFTFYLYVKRPDNLIVENLKGEIDYDKENEHLTRVELYLKWLAILKKQYEKTASNPSVIDELPK
jgi:hypothetical protein